MKALGVRRNIVIIFIAVGIFAPFMWMVMDREPPYSFESVEISPPAVEPGGEIYITFTIKQQRPPCGAGLIYRTFTEECKTSEGLPSNKLHTYDPVQRAHPPDIVNNQFTRIAKLPDNISICPTIYRGTSCYSCNPLQSLLRWPVCVSTPPVTFEVVEKRAR